MNLEGSAGLSGSRLRLTDGSPDRAASAWYPKQVNVEAFTQDFLFQITDPSADGMTFIIQNSASNALGLSGGALGYSPIAQSVAVKFDLYDNAGEGTNSTGLFTGGSMPYLPAVDLRGTPIDLHSQHIMAVHMTYDGSTLAMQIRDTETYLSFSTRWTVDIARALGGTTGYIGFGAGTGGATAVQDVLSWTFVSAPTTPTPAISPWGGTYNASQSVTITDDRQDATLYYTTDGSNPSEQSPVYTGPFTVQTSSTVKAIAVAPNARLSNVRAAVFTMIFGAGSSLNYGLGFEPNQLSLLGSATLNGSRLRLTDGATLQSANAWFTTPINVQSFTQDFLIQLSSPQADGMTFIIQSAGPSAAGRFGGSLGYAGIPASMAVKFDLYDNLGEGPNSTGIYAGGVEPMVPATDLRPTQIDLHSGHILSVHMTYDGTTLAMQITDTETNQNCSMQWTVDIPAAVGGTLAYIGFGGATGGLSAVQDVLAWTYVSPGVAATHSVSASKSRRGRKPVAR